MKIKFFQDVFCPWCYLTSKLLQGYDYEIVPTRFLRAEIQYPKDFFTNFLKNECKIIEKFDNSFKCRDDYPPVPTGERTAYTIQWVKVYHSNKEAVEVANKMREDLYVYGKKIWEDEYIKSLVPDIRFDDQTIELLYRANETVSDKIWPGIPKVMLDDYVIIGYRQDMRDIIDEYIKTGKLTKFYFILIPK